MTTDTPRRPLRPEEIFNAALALRERAEKAEAEVERLRKQLTRAIEIAEAVLSELHFPQWNDELDAIKATLSQQSNNPTA